MKAIHLTAYGDPLKNLQLLDIPEPSKPDVGEVIIRMEYSPIDPSDLLLTKGIYAIRPELPAVIGGQGIGIVEELGTEVTNVKIGDRVSLPFGTYAWSEKVKAKVAELFVIPEELNVQQAAMIAINPPTAVLLLDEFVKLSAGDWIVINAANSSVANTIITVAKSRGIKTLGIVRRADAVHTALKAGADIVLVESETVVEEAKIATDNANVRLGLDAVSGEASGILAQILGLDSHLVTYAVLSFQPMVISAVDIIFKRITLHGFWMFLPQYLSKLHKAKEEAAKLIADGSLNVPIASIYRLDQIAEAVAHTEKGEKVLLSFE
jgi:NADPH:quinone reductase-like Zn-dependent oxidoreductase